MVIPRRAICSLQAALCAPGHGTGHARSRMPNPVLARVRKMPFRSSAGLSGIAGWRPRDSISPIIPCLPMAAGPLCTVYHATRPPLPGTRRILSCRDVVARPIGMAIAWAPIHPHPEASGSWHALLKLPSKEGATPGRRNPTPSGRTGEYVCSGCPDPAGLAHGSQGNGGLPAGQRQTAPESVSSNGGSPHREHGFFVGEPEVPGRQQSRANDDSSGGSCRDCSDERSFRRTGKTVYRILAGLTGRFGGYRLPASNGPTRLQYGSRRSAGGISGRIGKAEDRRMRG